jgi:L-alanine-DL-glutamate epimerase-like enolase superfamily enzyme
VVTDAGVEGYGYSDLFPRTGETPETARHTIEEILKPKVIGRDSKSWRASGPTLIIR